MKLLIVAALMTVAAGGRLEHLERSYLPPDNNGQHSFSSSERFQKSGNGFGPHGGFQSSTNGLSTSGGHQNSESSGHGTNGFSRTNSFGSDDLISNGFHSSQSSSGFNNGRFGSATSNQYLPPDHGPSAPSSNAFRRSAAKTGSNFGSTSGFGSSSFRSDLGFDSGLGSHGSQYNAQSQFGAAASRQYLTPKSSPSFQSSPQQSFDEQSGYHY